jgi:hypothetical protein
LLASTDFWMMVSTLLCPETQMGASNAKIATCRASHNFIHRLRRISAWIFIPDDYLLEFSGAMAAQALLIE